MRVSHDSYLFAGPSLVLSGRRLSVPTEIDCRPPARRGDIDKLISSALPGTIILADGEFYTGPSVGHAELRNAIDLGWQVWGVGAMGAIRATELHWFGMKGAGQAYAFLNETEEHADDELLCRYDLQARCRRLSEPLIHLRSALASYETKELLAANDVQAILNSLKSRWYGQRTRAMLKDLVLECNDTSEMRQWLDHDFENFGKHQVTVIDLAVFLKSGKWRTPSAQARDYKKAPSGRAVMRFNR